MHPIRYFQLHAFLFQFSSALCVGFYIPYLLDVGLTQSDIFLVNVAFWLVIAGTEVATGALADRHSRGWAVRIGLLLSAIGTALYASAMLTDKRWLIMAIALTAEVLEGLGVSSMNGAQQAWISDALIHEKREDELANVLAKAAKWGSIGLVSGGALSFLLFKLGYLTGWMTRAAFILFTLAICAKWMNGEGEPKTRTGIVTALKSSGSALRDDYGLKWIAVAAVVFGLILPFNLTWVPHFNRTLGEGYGMGIWLAINTGLMVGAYSVQKLPRLNKQTGKSLPLALGFAGIGLASLGVFGGAVWSFMFVMLHELGRGMFQPLVDSYIYRRVGSEFKATYGSLHSMISRAGFALALLGNWLAVRKLGEESADTVVWLVCGVLLVAFGSILWLVRPKG